MRAGMYIYQNTRLVCLNGETCDWPRIMCVGKVQRSSHDEAMNRNHLDNSIVDDHCVVNHSPLQKSLFEQLTGIVARSQLFKTL